MDASTAEVESLADLFEGKTRDRAQPEHFALALGLNVPSVSGEREAVAVKLADDLVQLKSLAELGVLDQVTAPMFK